MDISFNTLSSGVTGSESEQILAPPFFQQVDLSSSNHTTTLLTFGDGDSNITASTHPTVLENASAQNQVSLEAIFDSLSNTEPAIIISQEFDNLKKVDSAIIDELFRISESAEPSIASQPPGTLPYINPVLIDNLLEMLANDKPVMTSKPLPNITASSATSDVLTDASSKFDEILVQLYSSNSTENCLQLQSSSFISNNNNNNTSTTSATISIDSGILSSSVPISMDYGSTVGGLAHQGNIVSIESAQSLLIETPFQEVLAEQSINPTTNSANLSVAQDSFNPAKRYMVQDEWPGESSQKRFKSTPADMFIDPLYNIPICLPMVNPVHPAFDETEILFIEQALSAIKIDKNNGFYKDNPESKLMKLDLVDIFRLACDEFLNVPCKISGGYKACKFERNYHTISDYILPSTVTIGSTQSSATKDSRWYLLADLDIPKHFKHYLPGHFNSSTAYNFGKFYEVYALSQMFIHRYTVFEDAPSGNNTNFLVLLPEFSYDRRMRKNFESALWRTGNYGNIGYFADMVCCQLALVLNKKVDKMCFKIVSILLTFIHDLLKVKFRNDVHWCTTDIGMKSFDSFLSMFTNGKSRSENQWYLPEFCTFG
ncbi:hypothetical protein H4219_001882 [Mycoemilia scoparia]|uniref:Uncharacterized protein n=1 Tax=Mycoemilia scoparia TaxID=417184 RepID=A0A9W8A5L9_9FUNG|nr:hypothetical protein H4219_001882 [Mycoemilia scoparia]